jgi:hypothetical protein
MALSALLISKRIVPAWCSTSLRLLLPLSGFNVLGIFYKLHRL